MLAIEHGRNEWKMGVESDNTWINENFNYIITDPSHFDDETAPAFSFPGLYPSQGKRPDLEQSAFGAGPSLVRQVDNCNASLRCDHYQFFVNRQALSPRLSRYHDISPRSACLVHFSCDRIFQTPSFENILLSKLL